MNNHEEHSVPNACWRCSLDLSKCDCVVSMPTPVKSAPAERNLSFQTRRAIKAEDALHAVRKEIKNLNELLNAAYVAPADPQSAMQINDRAIEIFRALHGQASPDIEDSLRLTVAQVLKESAQKQAQPELRAADHWFAEWELVIPEDARKAFQEMAQQAQPERAPSTKGSDQVWFAQNYGPAKQGGQHD